jgi:hypothetical protein
VTRGLGFSGLIQRTAPFSRLLRHTRGCGGSVLARIPTGPDIKHAPYTWNDFLLSLCRLLGAVCLVIQMRAAYFQRKGNNRNKVDHSRYVDVRTRVFLRRYLVMAGGGTHAEHKWTLQPIIGSDGVPVLSKYNQ